MSVVCTPAAAVAFKHRQYCQELSVGLASGKRPLEWRPCRREMPNVGSFWNSEMNTEPNDSNCNSSRIGVGIALGAGTGVAIGAGMGAATGNMGAWTAIGVACGVGVGLVIGVVMSAKKK